MEASESPKKTAEKQQNKAADQKKLSSQQDKNQQGQVPQFTDEEDEENPFGGISARDLKKNLGCGG